MQNFKKVTVRQGKLNVIHIWSYLRFWFGFKVFVSFSSDSRLPNKVNFQDILCSFPDLRFMLLMSSTLRITFPQMHAELI